jgi:hypothetical protein
VSTTKKRKTYYGDEANERFVEKLKEYFRPVIPKRPYSGNPVKFTDKNCVPPEGYREALTPKEIEDLKKLAPDLPRVGLEAILRRVYRMDRKDLERLTVDEIKGFCKDYIDSSEKEQASAKVEDEIKQTSQINQAKGGVLMVTAEASKENWEKIKSEYDCSKKELGRKINFVTDTFKKKIIFRDVEHAFVLASHGFGKPAVILAGSVIEELLKEYLKYKKVKPKGDRFTDYIKACEDHRLLKRGVSRLGDAIRDFRNLVHISNEESRRHTISVATAKGAVSSIFSIANDFH